MSVHATRWLVLWVFGLACVPAHAAFTERVSVGVGGVEANAATPPAVFVSNDGRYVVFNTNADNLVPGSPRGAFLRDRIGGTTTHLAPYEAAAITPDFALLAFGAYAGTLVPGDTNGAEDVFVFDRGTSAVERVSVGTGGTQALLGDSFDPQLSEGGRYVAFLSYARNLVPNDNNYDTDIFLHDRSTNETERVTLSSGGTEGEPGARTLDYAMTPDARFIAFLSRASTLAPGGVVGKWNVYVRDRATSTTELVSIAPDGSAPGIETCCNGGLSITPDGRFVAFVGPVDGDASHQYEVIVRDRQLGMSVLASPALDDTPSAGLSASPSLSDDGRYVAFASAAQDLVPGPPTESYESHVFVRDLLLGVTNRASVASDGTMADGDSGASRLSGDGRVVVFASNAANLVTGDMNGSLDLFARDRTCGDGATEGIEACDDGNNTSGDGCDANCTVTQCGNGQVTAGEACDDGADNGIDGCCSATCTLVDADGDGVCDAADVCIAPGVVAGKLKLLGMTRPHAGRFAFSGRVVLSPPVVPPLDPATNGLRIQVTDGATRTVLDTTIPGGAGWVTNGTGTLARYIDPTGTLLVKIQDRSASRGQVRFTVDAKGLVLDPAGPPLVGRIFLHPPDGSQGECGEARLACVGSTNGDRVRCQ